MQEADYQANKPQLYKPIAPKKKQDRKRCDSNFQWGIKRKTFVTCDEESKGEGDGEVERGHAKGDDLPEARHPVQPQLKQAAQARQAQERHWNATHDQSLQYQ